MVVSIGKFTIFTTTVNAIACRPFIIDGFIIGFGLALVLFAGIREQLALLRVPKGMQGMPIALLSAGLLALAFMGFSGIVKL